MSYQKARQNTTPVEKGSKHGGSISP
jgi:hypothetical protein